MPHYFNASRDAEAEAGGGLGGHAGDGPHIVAMDQRETQRQEAYYLFFVGSLGMALNILVITMIFIRRNLRRMTSAFLIHSGFLNLLKAGFCIPFGLNLLSEADETHEPLHCRFQGSLFVVLVTTSAVNMVAMVCTEAYTFGEVNVGGNSQGTSCCILFGLLVVYITSVILHLGPTLIGGAIKYNPDIGSCSFQLGHNTGYVANVMWIVIITLSFVGVGHFLSKLYREIQVNRPNRVSMLVRHSITMTDELAARKPSSCTVQEMTQEAMHRAKIFVITAISFVLCWYPLFILILIDIHFRVSPKVYQAFSFIAWTGAMVEPIILICFDRNLNLLARFMYCDRDQYSATQIAYLLNRQEQLLHLQQQQQLHHHHHHLHHLHDQTRQSSSDADDAFHCGLAHHHTHHHGCHAAGSGDEDPEAVTGACPCRNCRRSPGETTPLRPQRRQRPHSQDSEATAACSACELGGFRDDFRASPRSEEEDGDALEMNSTSFRTEEDDPLARKHKESAGRQGDIQC